MRSRLAFTFAGLSLLLYGVYACSSDSESQPGVEEDAGSDPLDDEDSGGGRPDTGKPYTGSEGGVTCVGNPLSDATDGGLAIVDAASAEPIATGNFNDGPQWVPVGGGGLYFSQYNANTLSRIGPNGGTVEAVRDIPGAIGNAYRDGVIWTTQANGTIGVIVGSLPDGGDAGQYLTAPAVDPNDLVVGPAGNIYFTDPRYQSGTTPTGLYRLTPAGDVSLIKDFVDARVNGIAYFPTTQTLYVGTTTPKSVVKYTVGIDGSVMANSEAPFLAAADIADDPDGIAVDVGGNVYVAEAATGGGQSGRVEVFSPAGAKIGEIPVLNERPVGVAFGGVDGKTLYITTETSILLFRNRCEGFP